MERGAAAASGCGSTSGLSNLQMDSETALGLVKQGATLLLLDVPQFTLFGIDTQVIPSLPIYIYIYIDIYIYCNWSFGQSHEFEFHMYALVVVETLTGSW